MNADVWGEQQLMVIAAFRYCLGRRTYIVCECVSWIIQNWSNFNDNNKHIIQRELDEEFRRDDEARLHDGDFKPLGWDCDRAEWEKVRRLYLDNPTSI